MAQNASQGVHENPMQRLINFQRPAVGDIRKQHSTLQGPTKPYSSRLYMCGQFHEHLWFFVKPYGALEWLKASRGALRTAALHSPTQPYKALSDSRSL